MSSTPCLNPQDPDFVPVVPGSRCEADDDGPSATASGVAAAAEAKAECPQEKAPTRGGEKKTIESDESVGAAPAAAGAKGHVCDACPHCDDLCIWASCEACNAKEQRVRAKLAKQGPRDGMYTWCQIKRHNRPNDVWLVAHGVVYDATEFMSKHPGGQRSILRHAGTDSTQDFDFHSKDGQGLWKDLRIGKVVSCPKDGDGASCIIM